MARDREIVCRYYSYAGGPCAKRQINVWLRKKCQTCKKYSPLPGGNPRELIIVDNAKSVG